MLLLTSIRLMPKESNDIRLLSPFSTSQCVEVERQVDGSIQIRIGVKTTRFANERLAFPVRSPCPTTIAAPLTRECGTDSLDLDTMSFASLLDTFLQSRVQPTTDNSTHGPTFQTPQVFHPQDFHIPEGWAFGGL